MNIKPKPNNHRQPVIPDPDPSECEFPEDAADPAAEAWSAKPDGVYCVRVVNLAPNNRFVFAALDGEKFPVLTGNRNRANLVGKTIHVHRVTDDIQTTYTMIP